jgi:GTP cyclohydrolase I
VSVYAEIEDLMKKRYEGWEGSEQFTGTGNRLRRMVSEMCWSSERIKKELDKCFEAVFLDPFQEMLVAGPTSVWALCPHHLLPCNFSVHIGYIPNRGVLGLSKFSRIALVLGKRPVMQEQYCREVADVLESKLGPRGCGVYTVGTHGCIMCRGVTQSHVRISTSVLRGCFLTDASVKSEFFGICRG